MNALLNLIPKKRPLYLLIFLSSVALLSAAYYFQLVMKLDPCPLCITIRFFTLLFGLFGLFAFLQNSSGIADKIYAVLIAISAAGSAFFSGRMVWLQHLPEDQVPACGPSLQYILESFPFWHALEVLLRGNGDCAEVVWQFLGLSMPTWTLIYSIGFIFIALFQLFRRDN